MKTFISDFAPNQTVSTTLLVKSKEFRQKKSGGQFVLMTLSDRTGDIVELAPDLPAADVVSLDRVICCYPNMPALVDASAGRARRLYGFVAPRERWLTRVGLWFANLFFRLQRNPFRVFVHSLDAVDGRLRTQGLFPRLARRTFLWEVRVYERSPTSA